MTTPPSDSSWLYADQWQIIHGVGRKERKNVYNVYRVKQTGSRQMTQPERPFEKCSYQNLKFLVIYFTMALQNI